MIDDLNPGQRKQLEEALLSAFNLADFTRMLNLEVGVKIGQEVNPSQGFRFVLSDLPEVSIRGGWLEKLLLGAHRYNSGNVQFNQVVQTMGVAEPQTIPAEAPQPIPTNGIHADGLLQKIVSERSTFLRLSDW